jgi:hypothetical protein
VGSKEQDHSPDQPRNKKPNPIKKITKAKKARSIVQVVECLPGKHKAPSSNPSSTPPQKKKTKQTNKKKHYKGVMRN